MLKRSLLLILPIIFLSSLLSAQQANYGSNAAAGHYLQVGDAKIYYEIYGSGSPIVLLHGGLLGSIGEYSRLIPQLKDHHVIAINTRGHGKSELGMQPLTYKLFADDFAAVIAHETKKPVVVISFSATAMASYILAAEHPELVARLMAVGGPIIHKGNLNQPDDGKYPTPEEVEKTFPKLVARLKVESGDPENWTRLERAFGNLRTQDIPKETVQRIHCPTLIAAGDRDPYKQEHFVEIFRLLKDGQLTFVPNCGHTVFQCNPELMQQLVTDFIAAR